jgi:hypothetical protein
LEAIYDVAGWNLNSVHACLWVLEKSLSDNGFRPTTDFFERALVFAMKLRERVNFIEFYSLDVDLASADEFCDNGISSMADKGTVDLSKFVLKLACNRCEAIEGGLKARVLAHALLKNCIQRCLHYSTYTMQEINAEELHRKIVSFPNHESERADPTDY